MPTEPCIRRTINLDDNDEEPSSPANLQKPHTAKQLRTSNLDQQTAKSCLLYPLHILVSLNPVPSKSTHRRNIPSCKLKSQFLGNATSTHRTCSKSISEQNQRFRSVALEQCLQTVTVKGSIRIWTRL
jgi:hypothetical protein